MEVDSELAYEAIIPSGTYSSGAAAYRGPVTLSWVPDSGGPYYDVHGYASRDEGGSHGTDSVCQGSPGQPWGVVASSSGTNEQGSSVSCQYDGTFARTGSDMSLSLDGTCVIEEAGADGNDAISVDVHEERTSTLGDCYDTGGDPNIPEYCDTFDDAYSFVETGPGLPVVPAQQTIGPCQWCRFRSDPVNTATGAYVDHLSDAALPGAGLGFDFERWYNSNDPTTGPLGAGWTHAYNASLALQANGDVLERAGDGQQVLYARQPDASFASPPGVTRTLAAAGGGYEVTRPDQVRWRFDAAGRLLVDGRTGWSCAPTPCWAPSAGTTTPPTTPPATPTPGATSAPTPTTPRGASPPPPSPTGPPSPAPTPSGASRPASPTPGETPPPTPTTPRGTSWARPRPAGRSAPTPTTPPGGWPPWSTPGATCPAPIRQPSEPATRSEHPHTDTRAR